MGIAKIPSSFVFHLRPGNNHDLGWETNAHIRKDMASAITIQEKIKFSRPV